jgi:hypothetical protein
VFGSHVTTQSWNLAWFSVAGSNVFSNVPFVLVAGHWVERFAEPELMWKVLALATTFAGNLTIVGSVANMIVVESVREHLEVGFWDYARFGIPITVLNKRGRGGAARISVRSCRTARRCGDGIGIESSDSILIQRLKCLSILHERRA